MIMPQEFYTISLISVIAVISFSTLFASHLVGINDYSRSALTVFHLYFISGFLGWVLFGLVEFSDYPISLSWLAIAYITAASMLFFMILGRVEVNSKTVLWIISHILFIAMELAANTLETELWIFTIYILINITILSFIALKRNKKLNNIGFNIISLALYIPLGLGLAQAYMLLNQYNLDIIVGLGILGAATSYSLVGLGFFTMMLVLERNSYELQAHKDELTGIYNRRGLNCALEYIVQESLRDCSSLSAIACDIDLFKKINDTHGHDTGDIVLKEFAQMLKNSIRGSDLLARTGGEEFILILPKSDLNSTKVFAERLRIKTEKMIVQATNIHVKLTACFGVATQTELIKIDELLKNADKALYDAKSRGRNQVCISMN